MDLINKKDLFLLEEIVKRNFASKYKDSVLGIFWSVLNPLLIMMVFTIVFSTLFTGRIENYPAYILSGKCIYDFFTGTIGISIMALKGNKNILLNTASRKYIFILGAVISQFINFIISLILLIIIMIIIQCPFYFSIMPLSIIPIISLILMVLGFSFIVSILNVYYADVGHLWTVISLIIMYGSALFYPMDIIPEPYHGILILNPVFWIMDQFRDFMVYGTIHNTLNVVNSLLLSTIILISGIIIFKKYEKRITLKL